MVVLQDKDNTGQYLPSTCVLVSDTLSGRHSESFLSVDNLSGHLKAQVHPESDHLQRK